MTSQELELEIEKSCWVTVPASQNMGVVYTALFLLERTGDAVVPIPSRMPSLMPSIEQKTLVPFSFIQNNHSINTVKD